MNLLDDRLAQLKAGRRYNPVEGRNLGEIAIEKTLADPDRIVVIDDVRSISRGQLLEKAKRLGGALAKMGIGPGATIGFQLPNWWEACVINMTACLFGYRLAPMLTIYRSAELGYMVPACEIEVLFVPRSYRGTDYPALVAELARPPRHVLTVRGNSDGANSFETAVESQPGEPSPAPADDLKLVLFTSGSTGRPKGVLHSHAAVDALIRRTAAFWETNANDRFYIPSPVGHIGGSIYAFEFPWITDATAILAERWAPDQAVSAIDGLGATFMAGATPFLAGLVEEAEKAETHLRSLRRFVCGGASVPPELIRRALDQLSSATVSRAYGSTEVPLVCPGTRNRSEAMSRATTDGQISTELIFLSDEGAAGGEAGEIAVRAPQMLAGYLDPADEEGCFTQDGYFRMGDLGRRIDGAFLEITGRKKDIIIRKGENISPLEIENALARHPAVHQSSVVGVANAERGEMVVAFVIPRDGRQFEFTDMTSHLTSLGLARQKHPERLHLVESLPVNSIGKVLKNDLRAIAAELEESTA